MKKIFYKISAVVTAVLLFSACSDFFDPKTETSLPGDEYIDNFEDFQSTVLGLAQTAQQMAEMPMFLEGMRGNLYEPTQNANQDFWDVYYYNDHRVAPFTNNEIASPERIYKLILNCNSFLYNGEKWLEENPNGADEDVLRAFIAVGLNFKAFAYMHLAKIYGEAYYIDDPLIQYHDIGTKYPLFGFNDIMMKCVDLIEGGVTIGSRQYNGLVNFNFSTYLDGTSEVPNLIWNRTFPSGYALLGECYLWLQNYNRSLYYLSEAITQAAVFATSLNQFRISSNVRGQYWERMFLNMNSEESFFGAMYDYNSGQLNNVRDYLHPDKSYFLRPAENFVESWDENLRSNRYSKTVSGTYPTTRLYKLLWNGEGASIASIPMHEPKPWLNFFRSAYLYALMEECLIGLNRFEAAMWVMNGAGGNVPNSPFTEQIDATGTFYEGFLEGLPVRMGISPGSQWPYMGFRGRADCPLAFGDVVNSPNTDPDVDRWYMDSVFVEEHIFEFSGEGIPYYAMLRSIQRWPEARAVWAEKVAAKYPAGVATDIKSLLEADEKNWFIKYDLN